MLNPMHKVIKQQYFYFFGWSYFFSFDYFCWANFMKEFSNEYLDAIVLLDPS